jgi:hypothetical protein
MPAAAGQGASRSIFGYSITLNLLLTVAEHKTNVRPVKPKSCRSWIFYRMPMRGGGHLLRGPGARIVADPAAR